MTLEGKALYPCALVLLCMGDAELHSRLSSANEKMARAVQEVVSTSMGYDAWVGDRFVNAFEYIGQPDSVIDIYNSFVSSYTRGKDDRVLSYRARALFDAKAIESYKVFYAYPILALTDAKSRKRIRAGIHIPSETWAHLQEQAVKVYRVESSPCHVVPVVLHRSRIAQAIETHFAQSIVATLKQGKGSCREFPDPVDPYFKLSSEWPEYFPVPVYGGEKETLVSHVHIPKKYETPATLETLQRKGWTVALS